MPQNNKNRFSKRPLDIPLNLTVTPSSPHDPQQPSMTLPTLAEDGTPSQPHPLQPTSQPQTLAPPSTYTPATAPLPAASAAASTTAAVLQNMFTAPSPPGHSSSYSSTMGGVPPGATLVDMDRYAKEEQVNKLMDTEFIPPRQAMNTDDASDFDWDEDIDIDGAMKKKKDKDHSKWRMLSPFMRMLILMFVVGPILALPAILVNYFFNASKTQDEAITPEYLAKQTIMMFFIWLTFMWCIIHITNWGVDTLPAVIVRITSLVSKTRNEIVKTRLLVFISTKKQTKWLIASCWAIGSFIVINRVFFPDVSQQDWYPYFIKALGAIIAGAGLVLLEKILLQVISKKFHKTAYADRIKDNKYALSVLDKLGSAKKATKKSRPVHSRHNSAADKMEPDFFSVLPGAYRSRQQSRANSLEMHSNDTARFTRSESPQQLVDGTFSTVVTPTEHHVTNSKYSSLNLPRPSDAGKRESKRGQKEMLKGINRALHGIAMADRVPAKDFTSTHNAKRLAKTLFYNLQNNGDEIVVKDFYPYFSNEEEAHTAFLIFDKDGNGDISKSEMKEKIFYIYKERKDLHTSLRDLSQAVGKLDIIFLTIVTVIWLLIVLSIFGPSVVQNMLSIGSFLVALSFVFGNSVKMLFENIVFLFITHPFDSGDLCNIDGNDMYVREVGLNSTMFVTWDGKRMYYPNNILSQKPIHNVRRSPNMSEKIVLNIDCYTPQQKIFDLRTRMREYLARESKEFQPDMEIQIQEMDLKLKISMCIEHKGNWQDSGRRWARRTKFNFALKEAVEELGIKYYALPQRLEMYTPPPESSAMSSSPSTMTSPPTAFPPGHEVYRRAPYRRHEGDGGE